MRRPFFPTAAFPFCRSLILTVLFALVAAVPSLQAGKYTYTDDFTGPSKPLASRKTAAGFSKWDADSSVTAGDGLLTVDQVHGGSDAFHLQMPKLGNRGKIHIVLRCRSSGTKDDSHISFGFVAAPTDDPLTTAALWTIDRSDSFALMYCAGPGIQNQTVGQSWYGEFPRDTSQETEHVIDYDLKTGRITVSIENNGNKKVLADNVPVNWNGVAGQAVPPQNLAYFTVSFYQQESADKGAQAAYVKSIKIDISDL